MIKNMIKDIVIIAKNGIKEPKSVLFALLASREIMKLNLGEYKSMRMTLSKKDMNVKASSFEEFVSLKENSNKFFCMKVIKNATWHLYVGAGDADGIKSILFGVPISEKEKKILDSLVTKSF